MSGTCLMIRSRVTKRSFLGPGRASMAQWCRMSTVSLGTGYEQHVMSLLPFILPGRVLLKRVGGAGDHGIDLRGWWTLPSGQGVLDAEQIDKVQRHRDTGSDSAGSRLRLIVQCKASAATGAQKRLGPQVLREVEGVIARSQRHYPCSPPGGAAENSPSDASFESLGHQGDPLVAIICSSSGFSKQTKLQTNALVGPHLILMHIPLPTALFDGQSLTLVGGRPSKGLLMSTRDRAQRRVSATLKSNLLSVLFTPSLMSRTGPLHGRVGVQWSRHFGSELDGFPVLTWDATARATDT